MVSTASMTIMVFNMIFGILVPIFLMLWIKKRYNASIKAFLFGMLTMFVFAFILEQIVHTVVFFSPLGEKIQGKKLALALYGGFAAGIFEECGRFLCMKFMLKKEHDNPHNALMYGAGHGGFEMVYLLTLTMFNNLFYSILNNTGNASLITGVLEGEAKEQVEGIFTQLVEYPAWQFLLSPWERVSALIAQLAFSVLVWTAVVRKGKATWFLLLAILMHALLDGILVPLQGAVPLVVIEVIITLVAIAYAFVVKCLCAVKNGDNTQGGQ